MLAGICGALQADRMKIRYGFVAAEVDGEDPIFRILGEISFILMVEC